MGKAESNSWRLSIANARDEIADLLDDNLKSRDRHWRGDSLRLPLRPPQGGDRDGLGGAGFSAAMPVEFR